MEAFLFSYVYSYSNSNHETEMLMDDDVKCVDTLGLSIMSEQSITVVNQLFCIFLHSIKASHVLFPFIFFLDIEISIIFN